MQPLSRAQNFLWQIGAPVLLANVSNTADKKRLARSGYRRRRVPLGGMPIALPLSEFV
jgi:hypothetical protein